jgi:hypothetical protein
MLRRGVALCLMRSRGADVLMTRAVAPSQLSTGKDATEKDVAKRMRRGN